jgi:hypothetical protein
MRDRANDFGQSISNSQHRGMAGGRKKQQADLTLEELQKIRGHLFSFACTESWIDAIMEKLVARDARGKRIVKYVTTESGRLKTKIPKLLELIADAMLYPPPADDQAKCYLRNQVYHMGSKMRPCLCEQCTLAGAGKRHVLWPANYMVKEHLSYTCAVNRNFVDPDLVEDLDPQAELLVDVGHGQRGRAITAREAAEQMRLDPDAWRRDKLDRLGLDAYDIMALRKHRWSQVTGNVTFDAKGKEHSSARLMHRGLCNIGSLFDFLDLGHSLLEVDGLTQESAANIQQLVNDYPREPRPAAVRMRRASTRVGSQRRLRKRAAEGKA